MLLQPSCSLEFPSTDHPGVRSLSLEGSVNQTAPSSATRADKLHGSLPCLPRTFSLLEMGHRSDSSFTMNLLAGLWLFFTEEGGK